MTSAGLSEELSCSICLSIYTNPVMLTCGHNFCQDCITSSLDSARETSRIYTCPECRAAFNKRPSLQINLKLCNIVEHYFSSQPKPKEPEFVFFLKLKRGFQVGDASDMILNVNTADINIAVTLDLRSASYCVTEKSRPHHPERFITQPVLSTHTFFAGIHCWKVKTSNKGNWSIRVTYNSVKRKGDTSFISNSKSWCLSMMEEDLKAEHNKRGKTIHPYSSASDLGIYLDYEGGFLSFYELSEPVKHLHTFTAKFTEPLFATFYLEDGAWVRIGS
ncbi:LOW QUALITY PROTEIN: ret finger protein-like 4A [Discoglossus pictus]